MATTFSDDLEIRYWKSDRRLTDFPDLPVYNYVEQVNRITALASSDEWRAFVQVDEVSLWANRYVLDGTLYKERDLLQPDVRWPFEHEGARWFPDTYANIEKVYFQRETELATVTVGDTYAAFGRGIALNVNRNVDIDIDTSIQGAKLVLRPGAWDLVALAGQLNRQQIWQDNPNILLSPNNRHAVAGVSAVRYGLGPATVGVHGVGYAFASEPGVAEGLSAAADGPDVLIGGVWSEAMLGNVDAYVEVDRFLHPTPITFGGAEPEPGVAAYGSANIYAGAVTVQVEGKHYVNAERVNGVISSELYEVAIAPTLEYERQITEDSSAAVNSNDISAAKVRVDWAAVPQRVIPYVQVAVMRDRDVLGGLHFNTTPETIVHAMAGTETRLDDVSVVFNGGYRLDIRDDGKARPLNAPSSACGTIDMDRQLHGDIDVNFPLPLGMNADITSAIEWYCWGVNPLQQSDYVEMESSMSVEVREGFTVIGYADLTTNPLVDTTGNLSDAWYGALELQVKPVDGLTLKAFYGAYKAGIRCSGGQCRLLPGFEGARVSATANF